VPKIDYDADEFFRFLELHSLRDESGSQRLSPSDDQEYQRLLGKYGVAPLDAEPVDPSDPACIPRGDAILSINCKPIPGFRALICPRSQPQLPAHLLPDVEQRCRTLDRVGPGETVLWVGRGPQINTMCVWDFGCDCFGSTQRRDRLGRAAADLVGEVHQVLRTTPDSEEFVAALARSLDLLRVLKPLRSLFKSVSEGLFPPRELALAFVGLSGALDVFREYLPSTGPTAAGRQQFAERLATLEQAVEEFLDAAQGVWPGLAASSDASLPTNEGDETVGLSQAAAKGAKVLLRFEPGAFVYRNHREELNGKPLLVLQALAMTRTNVLTLAALQKQCWQDAIVGEEAIRSAVKVARAALRRAIQILGIPCEDGFDPIAAVDRGTGRTAWRLQLP
jgi:hypothetical protein